jgi:hypothetical protein
MIRNDDIRIICHGVEFINAELAHEGSQISSRHRITVGGCLSHGIKTRPLRLKD